MRRWRLPRWRDDDPGQFAAALALPPDTIVIDKGTDSRYEAYSAFERTGLAARLLDAGAKRLLVGGLATDYCVLNTVRDAHGMRETAAFEFIVRKLPPTRNFLLAAGLEQALEFLEGLRFGEDELAWVEESGLFRDDFAAQLRDLRFSGDVYAMPEGTVFFPHEPILRVVAPMPQAQLVESRLINLLHYATIVASKAVRSVLVAPGKLLVDFGLRRARLPRWYRNCSRRDSRSKACVSTAAIWRRMRATW